MSESSGSGYGRSVWMSAAALGVAALAGPPASGQQAYFSVTGDFNTAGDQHDFNLSVLSDIATNPNVFFRTYANNGGTNLAGDTIAGGGIDSVLELTDSTTTVVGFDDDFFGVGLDSQIGFTGSDTPLPDPLPVESYRLNLEEFLNNAPGAWAVDLAVPASAATLTAVTPGVDGVNNTGPSTSTVSSFKFGTNPTGMGTAPATFNQTATLDVAGPLVVANTGDAVLNNTGTTTVTGLTTVNAGGTLNANAGSFTANGGVAVDGGTINGTFTGFGLGSGQTLTATNNAQVNLSGGGYTLGVGRTFEINSGADLNANAGLDIGSGNTGTLVVDGNGSTLSVPVAPAFWGIFGGTADVTVRNNAEATVSAGTIQLATLGNGSTGTLTVESAANFTANNINLAADTFGTLQNATATLNVTGDGQFSPAATLSQTDGSTLTIGGADPTSSATVNVTAGGVFTTGTGTTTVNANGTVNVNTAGDWFVRGDLVLNSGAEVNLDGTTTTVGQVAGNLDLNAGATLNITNTSNNFETLNLNGGTLNVTSGGFSTNQLNIQGSQNVNTAGFINLGDFAGFPEDDLPKTTTLTAGQNLTADRIDVGRGSSASLRITGGATVTSTSGSTNGIGSSFDNSRIGDVEITGSGSQWMSAGRFVIETNSRLAVNDGGLLQTDRDLTNQGTLRGNGTIQAAEGVTNEGTFILDSSTSNDPTVDGDFTQTATGRMEVGATGVPNFPLDAVEVTDGLTLAGELAFVSADPAADFETLPLYDPIQVITFNSTSLAGVFDTVTGHVLSDGTALAVVYGSDVGWQRVLFGDADRDGFIGQADLDAVLLNWGKNNLTDPSADVSWATGDYDGDGFIGQGDLDAVLLNWGDTFPEPGGSPVPEPGAAAVLLALVGVWRRPRLVVRGA